MTCVENGPVANASVSSQHIQPTIAELVRPSPLSWDWRKKENKLQLRPRRMMGANIVRGAALTEHNAILAVSKM